MKTLELEVYGRVQGVNFRFNVKEFCDANGIKGFVENMEDGRVLIVAQAGDEGLKKLVDFIKGNPGGSKVERVREELREEEEFDGFRIER